MSAQGGNMKRHFTILLALALVAALVSGCAVPGVSSPTSTPPSGQPAAGGSVEIRVTDAPGADNVTGIWVKVSEVEIHKATADQWISANITGPNPFDLLTLKAGGIQQVLATANIMAGKYTQIRMTIEEVKVELNNDGNLRPATLPSGKLKFVQPFEVKDWNTTVLLFDFDAEKSVNITGSGKITVKPVIKLIVEKPKPTGAAVKITTPSLPNGAVGVSYNATLEATGGTPLYTWSLSAGSLPSGLTLYSTGVISGTPGTGADRDYTFTVMVSDNSTPAKTNTKEYTITIVASGALIITTTSLPDGKEGQPYFATVFAIGGTAPYTWSKSGDWPTGLSLNPTTGLISGTPTKNAHFNFTVQVSDSSTSDNQSLSIQIAKD
jgi:hypothetical protein